MNNEINNYKEDFKQNSDNILISQLLEEMKNKLTD